MNQDTKVNVFRRSLQLTGSSWRVLKADKELLVMPLIQSFAFLIFALPFMGLGYLAYRGGINAEFVKSGADITLTTMDKIAVALLSAVFAFGSGLIANFFSAAVIHGVLERFRGNDPTVRGCISAAKSKFRRIALYTFVAVGIGQILKEIEARVPGIFGALLAWAAGAAWSIANIFSLQTIVDDNEKISLFGPTKKSLGIVKKVWGTDIVLNLGMMVLSIIQVVSWMMFTGLSMYLAVGVVGASIATVGAAILASILFLVASSLPVVLFGSIVKTALYYFTTTNESPKEFDVNVLKSTITPKKASKIFA